jgi:hypothetical protein
MLVPYLTTIIGNMISRARSPISKMVNVIVTGSMLTTLPTVY